MTLTTFTQPITLFLTTPLRLADLDEAKDFSDLEHLVGAMAGPYCTSIEFQDDNHKHGCRSLEWIVTTSVRNGYVDRDENGRYADTSPVRQIVWVPVRPTDSIQSIAERIVAEVKAIDSNIYA